MESFRIKENAITARRLEGNIYTLILLSDLWVEDHVFRGMDLRFKTFLGAHRLFQEIEDGFYRVYGAFDEKSGFLGVAFGSLEKDNSTWNAHVAFRRGADAAKCCLEIEKVLIEDYQKDGINLGCITGYIPECNRGAIRMSKRYGCKDNGISDKVNFMTADRVYPCREMRKELR